MRSFGTLCYVNLENITRLDAQSTQCRLLEYGVFNQYVVIDLKTREVYRVAHLKFDDYIKSSEIEDEKDDFAYLTLDFSPEQSFDNERLIDSDNQHTIANPTNSAIPRIESFDSDHETQNETQNTVSDAPIESESENSSNTNSINFEDQNSILSFAALSAPSNFAALSSSRRSRRQQVKSDFAHISSS